MFSMQKRAVLSRAVLSLYERAGTWGASDSPLFGKMGILREKLYAFLVESKTFRTLYCAA